MIKDAGEERGPLREAMSLQILLKEWHCFHL